MNDQRVIDLIEEALDLDQGSLTLETLLDGVEEYDSMAKLSLIVMADDEFGKTLTSDIIKQFNTVGDIVAALQ